VGKFSGFVKCFFSQRGEMECDASIFIELTMKARSPSKLRWEMPHCVSLLELAFRRTTAVHRASFSMSCRLGLLSVLNFEIISHFANFLLPCVRLSADCRKK